MQRGVRLASEFKFMRGFSHPITCAYHSSFATSSPTITFTRQARRPLGAAPIAMALQPQQLQSCRSSLLSAASSPRTPCGSPRWSPIYFSSALNRNSTDSWNSSNGPDELEWEWKPEQVLLLTRVYPFPNLRA